MRVDIKLKWDAIALDDKVTVEDLKEMMHSGMDGNDIHQAVNDWYDATYDELSEDNRQSSMDFEEKDKQWQQ